MSATPTQSAMFRSVNPADGSELAVYEASARAEVDLVLDRARDAFEQWSAWSAEDRARALAGLAEVLRARRSELARLMTLEMGKPIAQALAEVEKCAVTAEWLCEHGPAMLKAETMPTYALFSEVRFEPLGVVLAIMPWNYPLWQVLRAAIPALLAGNVIVLKHAPNVTGSALATAELFAQTGCAADVLQVVLTGDDGTAEIIADDRVAGVTLTGSVRAGQAVGEIAGKHLKKVVLELGGSDPFIVLDDADIAAAATAACRARVQNNGQSCIAAKRFIVVESVAEEFTRAFVEQVSKLTVGDPLSPTTDVGPLAREDLRDSLERQFQESVEQGATVAVGGDPIDQPGWWFTPTVLTDVRPDMTLWREETFGPLTGVLVVPDGDVAIEAAKHPEYGLGTSIWTRDWSHARDLADRIDSGMVFINTIVQSDVRLPFGGIKRSGLGRELSIFGVREFVNVKSVCVGEPGPHS